MARPVKPPHYRAGKLRVTAENVKAIDIALRIGIEEGRAMIDAWSLEMERTQDVMDHPDATPEVVEKGKSYKAALHNLINVTAGIIHEHQSALYTIERGPL